MKQKKKNGYNLDDFGLLFSEASEKSMLLRKKDNVADSTKIAESSGNHSSLRDSAKQNRGNPQDLQTLRSNHPPIEKTKKSQGGLQETSHSLVLPREQSSLAMTDFDELPRSITHNDNSTLDSANHTKIAESSNPPTPKNPQSKDQDFIYAPQFKGFDEILAQNEDFGTQNFNVQDFSTQTQSAESNTKAIPPSEKDLLLRHPHTQNDTNALFVAYSILFLMLLIFMPQVYLANNIYTSSKNINYLKSQKDALRDENSDLQKRLESVKFNFLTLEIEEIK